MVCDFGRTEKMGETNSQDRIANGSGIKSLKPKLQPMPQAMGGNPSLSGSMFSSLSDCKIDAFSAFTESKNG
jgi:hypothetical protein